MLIKEITAVYIDNYRKPLNTKCSVTVSWSKWYT